MNHTDGTNPHLLFRELERGLQRHRRPTLRPEYHCPHCGGNDTQSLSEAINDNRRDWTLETSQGTRAGRFIRPDLAGKDPGPKPVDLLVEWPWAFVVVLLAPVLLSVGATRSAGLAVLCAAPGLVMLGFGAVGHLRFPRRIALWEQKAWDQETKWRCRQCGEEWNPDDRIPTPLPDPSGGVSVKKISTADLPSNGVWIDTYRKAE